MKYNPDIKNIVARKNEIIRLLSANVPYNEISDKFDLNIKILRKIAKNWNIKRLPSKFHIREFSDDKLKIIELYTKRHSMDEIVNILGYGHRVTLAKYIKDELKLDVKKGRKGINEQDLSQLKILLSRKVSVSKIAQKINCSRQTVYRYMESLNLKED